MLPIDPPPSSGGLLDLLKNGLVEFPLPVKFADKNKFIQRGNLIIIKQE